MPLSITKPTVGGSEDTWGTTINTGLDAIVSEVNNNADGTNQISPNIGGTVVTADGAEINKLDGLSTTAAELGALAGTGVTVTNVTNLVGFSNAFTSLPSTDGTSGQVLSTDGAGNLSFTTIAAGSTLTAGSGIDITNDAISVETDLRDGITHIGRDANDYMAINTTSFTWYINGGQELNLDSSGNLTATGNVTAYSDERLKTDIHTVDDALNTVCNMRGVFFEKDGQPSVGVIAQEMQKALPEVVHDDGEYLSVAYGNIVGVLIEAIKELKSEVEELRNASTQQWKYKFKPNSR